MSHHDPRVDAYIAKAAAFAQPILKELRARVHAHCPQVVETIKWGMPAFEYQGPLANMAAFKAHCAFGFWKHQLIIGEDPQAAEAMGSFGRLTSLKDLPTKTVFARWMRRARELNEQGVQVPKAKARAKARLAPHPDFQRALDQDARARAGYQGLAPGQQREYCEWISEAKQESTRQRRIEQALPWLREGKTRHWKYQVKAQGKPKSS
jgi:uncharacterized protein YdeI (YjbR/CyaY-like superfamily)